MLLVPRQLRRAGMTGEVPYYGGRFTPAQAYAASHPAGPRSPARPAPPSTPTPSVTSGPETLAALQQLLDAGVLTTEEYQGLRTRIEP